MIDYLLKRFFIAVLLTGLLAGCMSLEKMYIPQETQAIVQEKVEGRYYAFSYVINERINGDHSWSESGIFRVEGDSLYIRYTIPSLCEDVYRITDYLQSKTERGVTVITFSALRRDEKGEEIRLPCRIRIYAVDKVDLYIGKEWYRAKFHAWWGEEDHLANFKNGIKRLCNI